MRTRRQVCKVGLRALLKRWRVLLFGINL